MMPTRRLFVLAATMAMLRSSGFEIVEHPEPEVFLCRAAEPPSSDRAVYPAKGLKP